MAAELLSIFRPTKPVSGDWSIQEIAEFYRVEAALVQAGANVFVDRGISDEGDPWFVFCRSIDGEVIVHFARIGGKYLIVSESVGLALRGSDFRRLLTDFVELNPALIPMPSSRSTKLTLHPAALLAAVVATALYHMSGTEAVANALDPTAVDEAHFKSGESENLDHRGEGDHHSDRQWTDRQIAAAVAAMCVLSALDFSPQTKEIFSDLASTILELTEGQQGLVQPTVAQVLPLPGFDDRSLLERQIISQDIHTWIDSLLQPGAGQSVLQEYQIKANDTAFLKWPSPSSDVSLQDVSQTAHWWDSLSNSADTNPKFFAWADPSTSLASSGSYGVPSGGGATLAPVVALQALNQATQGATSPGSSSPDQPTQLASDFQAASFVNLQLGAVDHVVSKFALNGNMSFQDVVNFAASEAFGPAVPSAVQANIQIGTSPTLAGTSSAPSALQSASAAVPYQPPPFNAAASEIVTAFMQQNDVEEVISNHNVVLFDANPSHFSSPDFVFKTWSMTDGSTITIIGSLPHNLALVA